MFVLFGIPKGFNMNSRACNAWLNYIYTTNRNAVEYYQQDSLIKNQFDLQNLMVVKQKDMAIIK
jgi:hypothetical protein